jgi:hypothetical protein
MTSSELADVKTRVETLCQKLEQPTGRHDHIADPHKREAAAELRYLLQLVVASEVAV